MRILHVIPSISDVHGGPSRAVREMAAALQALGHKVEIATTDDDGPGKRGTAETLEQNLGAAGVKLHLFRKQTGFYKVSLPLARWLRDHVKEFDVVHVHALFSFSSLAAARAARRAGVPCIIRPLGVLNRYGMIRRRARMKRWSLRLLEAPLLRRAAAVHFTTRAEMAEAQELGIEFHGVVIPLGVSVPPAALAMDGIPPAPSAKQSLLFLSRLDPVKNIESLLQAWASLQSAHESWVLTIAGGGDPAYADSLHKLSASLGLQGKIVWAGEVTGAAKWSLMESCSIYVLPSYSENFGIAAVEAMRCGCACVLAKGVAIAADAAAAGACVVCDPGHESIAESLRVFLDDPEKRQAAASAARSFAADRFSPEAMAAALTGLYGKLLLPALPGTPVVARN
jgi:glycosyltransferase involved in cell wall biosynthesis